jgi:hypothetical protein
MGKVLMFNPLAVPRFINRSESFIGIFSDADTTGLYITRREHRRKKARKKERKKER